jgi:hypothetical protein
MNSTDEKLFPQGLDFQSWLEYREKTARGWGTVFGKKALPEPNSKPPPSEGPEQEEAPRKFSRLRLLTEQFA